MRVLAIPALLVMFVYSPANGQKEPSPSPQIEYPESSDSSATLLVIPAIGVRAFDSEPDKLVGQLTRRDAASYSDAFHVLIDSYFDRRTAFQFGVNPVGVKTDVYRFDDTDDDPSWNLNANGWQGWSFGGERLATGGNINGSLTLLSYWLGL